MQHLKVVNKMFICEILNNKGSLKVFFDITISLSSFKKFIIQ